MFNLFKRNKKAGVILMYHRINTAVSDTWQLCVSPECFAEQMEVLKKFRVISLQQAVKDISKKEVQPDSVVITFDDGYLDNFTSAKSILEKHKYPTTFFITNASQQMNREYWWDQLEYILLENTNLPGEIKIALGENSYRWDLQDGWQQIISEDDMKDFASWLPWQEPPTTQHALFIYLSEWIKSLSYPEQTEVIDQLFKQCGKGMEVRDKYRVMNSDKLKELSNSAGFEIGGHSAWHTALGKFDEETQYKAIQDNKIYLERTVNKSIAGYGFAHGSYNQTSVKLLRKAGFSYACTTEEAVFTEASNPLALPRFQVKNIEGSIFKKQLENWFKI